MVGGDAISVQEVRRKTHRGRKEEGDETVRTGLVRVVGAGCGGYWGRYGAILRLLWPGGVRAVAGIGAVGRYGNQALFNTAFNTKSF